VFKKSSAVICIILLGIIFGIKSLFETLGYFNYIFLIFNNDAVSFAIITTLFYLLYKKMVLKGKRFGASEDESVNNPFMKIYKIFILITWIISIIFISIPLLRIQRTQTIGPIKVDIFYLGFIWAGFTVGFDILITILINKVRTIEKQIPEIPLKYAMYSGGLISFGIWSIQLVIFELYLKRLFGIIAFDQDIRILIIVISGLYGVIFYISLKKKFMPSAKERSALKLQKALELLKDESLELSKLSSNHIILNVKELTTYFYTEEGVVRAVENVSFKICYVFWGANLIWNLVNTLSNL